MRAAQRGLLRQINGSRDSCSAYLIERNIQPQNSVQALIVVG